MQRTKFSTKVQEVEIEIDGAAHVVREPMKEDMDEYRELIRSGRTGDPKEEKVGFATADAALACRCLFRLEADGRKPVPPETFASWPWRVQRGVIDIVDEIGELIRKPEDAKERAKNSQSASAT